MPTEPFASRVTRLLGRWLSRWGVDADQYHWLLQASLRMDFRSRGAFHGSEQSSHTKSALMATAGMYVIFSLILAGSLRAAGVGTFFFSTIMFAYSMTMMAMSILMEFGLVVISPDDFLILAHRPISSRTFFAVKCSNLLFYTLLMDLCLSLAPALIGWTFGEAPWHFPLVYLGVAALAGVFVAAGVTAVYGMLLQRVNYERFKDLLAWCQVLFSFVFFLGYQLIPRLLGGMHGFRVDEVSLWIAGILPPLWFASLSELGLGHFSRVALASGSIAVIALAFLLPGLLRSVSLDYSDRLAGMVSAATNRPATRRRQGRQSTIPWLERSFIPHQEERALFRFLLIMLRRNRQLKLQLYPNFGIVLALFAVGVFEHGTMADPLAGGKMSFITMFPAMAFLFGAMGFTALLPYSDEYQGGWIFYAAPIRHPERFLKAIKKAVALMLFVPLFLLNVTLFSFLWPFLHAVAIGLYGLGVGLVTFQATLFWFRAIPLTCKPEKGSQSQRLAMTFMMMIAYGIFVALPTLFASNPVLLSAVITLLFVANFALGSLNNRAYARAVRQSYFGED